jgi:CBS-domain-containing membrane protein
VFLFVGKIAYSRYFPALIYMLIRSASQRSYAQLLLRAALEGEPVRRFMRRDPVVVRPEISICQFVEDYIYRYDFKVYPVVGDLQDRIGCITPADVKDIAKEEWDRHRVSEVIRPCSEVNIVSPDTDVLKAFSRIRETGASGASGHRPQPSARDCVSEGLMEFSNSQDGT